MGIIFICCRIILFEDFINIIKILIEIVFTVLTGVSAIIGISYLKKLREKKSEAVIGFWIRLEMQILMIYNRINDFPELLASLCEDDSIEKLSVKEMEDDFYKMIQNALDFITSNSNQVPLSAGWTQNYKKFVSFLNDYIQYSYRTEDNVVYFHKFRTSVELQNYICEQKEYMKQLINIIDTELEKIEDNFK